MNALHSEEIKALGEGFPDDMPHFPSMYRVIRKQLSRDARGRVSSAGPRRLIIVSVRLPAGIRSLL